MEIKQYDIVLVNLDLTIGSEIKKTRPCLVISPKEMNKFLKTLVIAPMTTSDKSYPTRVLVIHNKQKGMAAIDQVRTIDKSRIIRILGRISDKEIETCKAIIKETFVD